MLQERDIAARVFAREIGLGTDDQVAGLEVT
jgi:hypothetical protein